MQLKNLLKISVMSLLKCEKWDATEKAGDYVKRLCQRKKEEKRKQAEGLQENWRGWVPDRLNPQRQQAVWINVTSAAPRRATEAQRAHPQDRSSRSREKVTAVWGEHLIDPCARAVQTPDFWTEASADLLQPDSLRLCNVNTCLYFTELDEYQSSLFWSDGVVLMNGCLVILI